MIPLLGFLPDADTATPGALVDCVNVTPYAKGLQGAPSAAAVTGVPALAAACRGAVVASKLDGTRRVFSGTDTKLYELTGGAWVDVSRGTSYTLGVDDRWSFVQFGNASLAANKSAKVQRSNGAGAFADIATAPKAVSIVSAAGFVLAFNTDDTANGDNPDRWQCSGINDETLWTPSLVTQATTGRLVSAPGAITAALAFGDQVAVYKDRAMYLGRYVGSPAVWEFDLIPGDVGCVGPDAVADVGPFGHLIVSRADIVIFDGTRPQSIAEGAVRQWFFNNCSQQYLYRAKVVHDKQNNTAWIFYPSLASSGETDAAIVYHLGTKRWGRCTQTVEAAINYVSAGLTIDDLSAFTFDTLPAVSFDSQFWLAGGRMMTVFNAAHQLCTMTGVAGSSSFTLFDVGDDADVTHLVRLRVGYQVEPGSGAAVSGVVKMARGAGGNNSGSGIYSAGKFDVRQSGRFHRLTVTASGNWSASGVDFDLRPAGAR